MQQNQHQTKITRKVIIINQKSEVIAENLNKLNTNKEEIPQFKAENQDQIENANIPQFAGMSVQIKKQESGRTDNYNCVQEMMAMYQKNLSKLKELQTQISMLKERTLEAEKQLVEMESVHKKKKKRRTAAEIEKSFKCPYQNCDKTYGSDVSLNLHIKFKHNGGNKSERERIQRQLQNGELNESNVKHINLPPA